MNVAFKSSIEERECKCPILFPNLSNIPVWPAHILHHEFLQKFKEPVA